MHLWMTQHNQYLVRETCTSSWYMGLICRRIYNKYVGFIISYGIYNYSCVKWTLLPQIQPCIAIVWPCRQKMPHYTLFSDGTRSSKFSTFCRRGWSFIPGKTLTHILSWILIRKIFWLMQNCIQKEPKSLQDICLTIWKLMRLLES